MFSFAMIAFSATAAAIEQQGGPSAVETSIWRLLLNCSLFGFMGIAMVVIGFKVFDLVITRIDLEAEILKGNLAAAILSAAAIMGISIIIAFAIH
jgi:putative membrane protein